MRWQLTLLEKAPFYGHLADKASLNQKEYNALLSRGKETVFLGGKHFEL